MKLKSLFLLSQILALTVISVFPQSNNNNNISVVPGNIKSIINRNQSFGLNKYPISFWNYTNLKNDGKHMTKAAVEEWADAGFTVPMTSNYNPADKKELKQMLKMLDWAKESGIKLILCDPRCYAPDVTKFNEKNYIDGVNSAVQTFGKQPALFGFCLGDEPDAANKDVFFKCYRLQKNAAPALHPFANLLPYFQGIEERAGTDSWANYLDEYSKKSNPDLYSYDCYAQMNPGDEGWNNYYENLRLYREASLRNGVPFWNTILSVGHFRYRVPDFDEIRWQFNTTIASGANGILWFFYYMRVPYDNYRSSPIDDNWERTQTYYNLRSVQKDFHRHYGDLFNKLVSTRVTFYGKTYGGGKIFTPDGIISGISTKNPDHPILIGEFTDINGRRYVMIVNNSMTESVHVGVDFPGKDVKLYTMSWEGKEVEGTSHFSSDEIIHNDNGLSTKQWLAPGQEVLYRVESASASKEPFSN